MINSLECLIKNFTYEKDKGLEALDWFILKDNKPKGDCEDFAITAAWLLAEKKWFKFWVDQFTGRSQIWAGRQPGGFHAALRYKGKWIDNQKKSWQEEPNMALLFPVIPPLLFFLMLPRFVKYPLLALFIVWGFYGF